MKIKKWVRGGGGGVGSGGGGRFGLGGEGWMLTKN